MKHSKKNLQGSAQMVYYSDDMENPENQFGYWTNSFCPNNPDNQIMEKNKT